MDVVPSHIRRGKRCGVYCLTDKKTGQKYVGASTNIVRRFLTHRFAIKAGLWHPWRKDILQDDIEIELLEATVELTSRENFWIQHFKESGYSLVNRKISSRYSKFAK